MLMLLYDLHKKKTEDWLFTYNCCYFWCLSPGLILTYSVCLMNHKIKSNIMEDELRGLTTWGEKLFCSPVLPKFTLFLDCHIIDINLAFPQIDTLPHCDEFLQTAVLKKEKYHWAHFGLFLSLTFETNAHAS